MKILNLSTFLIIGFSVSLLVAGSAQAKLWKDISTSDVTPASCANESPRTEKCVKANAEGYYCIYNGSATRIISIWNYTQGFGVQGCIGVTCGGYTGIPVKSNDKLYVYWGGGDEQKNTSLIVGSNVSIGSMGSLYDRADDICGEFSAVSTATGAGGVCTAENASYAWILNSKPNLGGQAGCD